jgi:hypothetical protein
MSQGWLLVIAGIAAVVILSSRAAAIWDWILVKFNVRSTDSLPEEIGLIVNMVKASKLITDKEQKQKVMDACVACFMGWINSQVAPSPPPTPTT